MKKRIVFLIFVLIVGSFPVMLFRSSPVSANPSITTSELIEDFENWDVLGWSKRGSTVSASTDAAYSGTYGIYCYGNNANGEYINDNDLMIDNFDPNITSIQVNYMLKWKNTSVATHHTYPYGDHLAIFFTDNALQNNGNTRIYLNYTASGFSFRIFTNTVEEGIKHTLDDSVYSYDTWYNITYIYRPSLISLAVNGVVTVQDTTSYPSYANGSHIDGLSLGMILSNWDTDDGYIFLDDINVQSAATTEITGIFEDVDDDGADWVFTDWKYYQFTLTSNELALIYNASIQFTVNTGVEMVTGGFYSDASNWIYSSNMSYTDREGEPFQLKEGSWSYNATTEFYTVTFDIWFTTKCLDLWDASDGVDVYYALNSGNWTLGEADMFRIYNKGGFTLNAASSNSTLAYIIDGGSPFSFHVEEDGGTESMYNEIWYRDAQHMKISPDINFLAGYEDFSVLYGFDYSLGDGYWQRGIWINIQPEFVSYTGIFAGNVWINMTTTLQHNASWGTFVQDVQYMFYHGSVASAGDPGHWSFWVDLWFSDKNASSVGAARLNAYEFPMEDTADLWLRWLANNWGVKDDVSTKMRGEVPLLDNTNATISSEKIKMVRYWSKILVYGNGTGQTIDVKNFNALDVTLSQQLPLTGVSDPIFDETTMPSVGNTGILGALWSMFSGLGAWLSENVIFGGLNMWGTFVAFLDTIAGFFGAPTFFTDLFTWIGQSVGYVGTAFTYLIEVVADVFSLFGSLLATFLDTMGNLITSLVNTVTVFTDMMGGAYGAGVDIWETLGISQWLTVAMIFYPLYLVILWDQEGMDAVIQQLTWLFGLLSWVFTFMSGVIMEGISLISTLIESIPVAE